MNRVEALPGMLGEHPEMRHVYALARKAAASELPVVIVGETGTGKELVARAVHALSSRSNGPFIDVNCAAIQETLADAELFGWERGSFTGAHRTTPGLLEAADGGTLFLDEVCSLPLGLQAKLLRAIELRSVRRVGARSSIRAVFRLVTAMSEPIDDLLRQNRLRLDFVHRIRGMEVVLPALRERRSDLPMLASHFLNDGNGHPPRAFTDDALTLLSSYPWPGNVRELRMFMERLSVLIEGHAPIDATSVRSVLPPQAIATLEREDIERVLDDADGSVAEAARVLGVPRTTLRRRLGELRLKSDVGHGRP